MDINADLSKSPLFALQDRMHKRWGLISFYICIGEMLVPDHFKNKINKNSNTVHKSGSFTHIHKYIRFSMRQSQLTYKYSFFYQFESIIMFLFQS